jgi:hypothetical protein
MKNLVTKVYTFIRQIEVCNKNKLHTFEEQDRRIVAVTSATVDYEKADAEAYSVYRRLMTEANISVPEFGQHTEYVDANGDRFRIKMECAEWVNSDHFYAVSI